ncbi:major facilitator superfamily MFS_1 [Richelia sinica FACHB-800]|uniref:Major facilitator superfamily MFS_1 n=1 Tax=Richelia sinica FACHB-800 TaxID=1357546 RepID=A0A975T4Z8_9NOST|nr:MFS transporter [Richelia sinica]MBD2664961.1 MFS transporter [Richelia sinica FACHB-800]QXE22278.1 major facilitator superfamily MFS_1 [Richelia sinica FACHB-800]
MELITVENIASTSDGIAHIDPSSIIIDKNSATKIKFSKHEIRTSLRASTMDGILSGIFSLTTNGIFISNFLVDLHASPIVFGMLASIPMLVNLIQPLGAYISERTTSRCQYSLLIYGISRLMWVILLIGIISINLGVISAQNLILITLIIVLFSHLLGGLGSASWLSWLAMIVPRRLRGRYFGLRNGAICLTNLLCVPLLGFTISHWYGGTIQGYGVVLCGGLILGLMGLGCQYFKVDVNPQLQNNLILNSLSKQTPSLPISEKKWHDSFHQNSNFVIFLIYLSLWIFSINLSAPFVNYYLLEILDLNISWVTVYSSLQSAASLMMLIFWGKLADKIGNRIILIVMGIVVAITPLLWLLTGRSTMMIWLWLPLIHIVIGGTGAAIDLCNNNMHIGIAPIKNQSIYFAITAAVTGVTGALGAAIGGMIAQFLQGGLMALFALSSLCMLGALMPLIFVEEAGEKG